MEQEQNYLKGFNDGNKMQKYSPELFAKLKGSLSNKNEYERGVLEGAQEAEKEKENSRMTDLKQLRDTKEPSKEKGVEK